MKRLKKRLNWEDLSKLTNEELYAIHAKIFKCDPILVNFQRFSTPYPEVA